MTSQDSFPVGLPAAPVTRTIKRFAPLQLGKVLGVLYGAMGLLLLPIFLLMALAPTLAAGGGRAGAGFAAIFGLGFAIAMPIMYAVMGFITGVIGAFVY